MIIEVCIKIVNYFKGQSIYGIDASHLREGGKTVYFKISYLFQSHAFGSSLPAEVLRV